MARIKICKESDCDNAATTAGFCRLHYLKNWKALQLEQKQRAAKKLNGYIESICRSHPENYVDVLKKEIRSPKFDKSVAENFGRDDNEDNPFNEPTFEEDVEKLLKELKVDKDYHR